jgi:dihydroorotate dehydrogenase electron transfer subunit
MNEQTNVVDAKVIGNFQENPTTFKLVLEVPFPVDVFQPGQFVCLAPLSEPGTFSRPFSVFMVDSSKNSIVILYSVVGENTKLMSQLKVGQTIRLWGPLGHDPKFSTDYNQAILIAGGIGIAPMQFLREWLQKFGVTTYLFYGNRTRDQIVCLPDGDTEIIHATENGSKGHQGFITERFEQEYEHPCDLKTLVITCGPTSMMEKITQICSTQPKFDCYVILEQIMACGVGVCLGCSVKMTSGMKCICKDGPVFLGKEVIWHELT